MYNELIYYYALFLIILAITFVKVRRELNGAKTWTDYFLFAQEVLYTAAGVIIFLLNKLNDFREGVFGIYLFLVIATAGIDSLSDKKNKNLKGYYNVFIIVLIFVVTFIIFTSILPSAQIHQSEQTKKIDSTFVYKVAIPYNDNTLIKHVGRQLFNKRRLVYLTKLESKNEKNAIEQALEQFDDTNNVTSPLKPNAVGAITPFIEIDYDNIIVQKIETLIKEVDAKLESN